mgnify:CR=1 FL=1
MGGIDAQAFVDEHDSVVVSANHSAGRDNFEDRILRRLLINATQVPQLPQSDFVNVIQLVGRRQWAAALTVLCTQVHERRLPLDWRRTKAVIEAGAEEVEDTGDGFVVETEPQDVVAVRTALQEAGIDYDSAEVQFVASTEVELDLEGALKVNKLIDALEDSDDVQNIYTNMSLSDEVRAQLEEAE